MKIKLQDELNTTKRIGRFARRNYETYKEHYKSRNMIPTLTLDDFMKNYSS